MSPLRRVDSGEVLAGMPLPFDVFDRDGKTVFTAGIVIGSVGYLRLLLGRGLYRDDTKPPTPPPRSSRS